MHSFEDLLKNFNDEFFLYRFQLIFRQKLNSLLNFLSVDNVKNKDKKNIIMILNHFSPDQNNL